MYVVMMPVATIGGIRWMKNVEMLVCLVKNALVSP